MYVYTGYKLNININIEYRIFLHIKPDHNNFILKNKEKYIHSKTKSTTQNKDTKK